MNEFRSKLDWNRDTGLTARQNAAADTISSLKNAHCPPVSRKVRSSRKACNARTDDDDFWFLCFGMLG